jgi:signal transduction histidine kinase
MPISASTGRSKPVASLLAAALVVTWEMGLAQDQVCTPMAEVPERIAVGEKPFVRGVVTGDIIRGYTFVEDASGAICLLLADSQAFAPGDVIEAMVMKYDARDFWHLAVTAEKVGSGKLPDPISVSEGAFSVKDHHGRFLRAEGRVTGHSRTTRTYQLDGKPVPLTYDVITVDCDGLPVRLCLDLGMDLVGSFPEGSVLRFTGSARIHEIKDWPVNPYVAIWVDDPAWIEVLALPTFWERKDVRRGLRIGGFVLIGLVFLAIVGVFWQRRYLRHLRRRNEELELRVAERTEELRGALERERKLGLVKSDFVSLVSHEFRTPLGVIMSAAEVLMRYFDRLEPEKRQRHLEMIRDSTGNLAAMIEEVLLLGRMDEGKLSCAAEPLDLEAFCRVIADEINSATKAISPIRFEALGDLRGAFADKSLLRHILSNLLSNACKYSFPAELVRFEVSGKDGEARFVIEDHGIGILEEDRERLFTSFTRGSNVGMLPGTGLGLVIVNRCVEMHGGRFQLDSIPGVGTKATVWLPLFSSDDFLSITSEPTTLTA